MADAGAIVVDNSSAWRKDPEVPLVVSEVNPGTSTTSPRASSPTPTAPRWRRCRCSSHCTTGRAGAAARCSYQAVSGSGGVGLAELDGQLRGGYAAGDPKDLALDGSGLALPDPKIYAVPVAFNVVPLAGSLVDDGSLETDEEQKLRNESRKILHIPGLRCRAPACACPCSRATAWPCMRSSPATSVPSEALAALRKAPGVVVTDVPNPLMAAGRDDVYVGRMRVDQAAPDGKGLVLFVVGDNLRKGAALNAVQIAEELLKRR